MKLTQPAREHLEIMSKIHRFSDDQKERIIQETIERHGIKDDEKVAKFQIGFTIPKYT